MKHERGPGADMSGVWKRENMNCVHLQSLFPRYAFRMQLLKADRVYVFVQACLSNK